MITVQIDDKVFDKVESANIVRNWGFDADTFEVTVPLSPQLLEAFAKSSDERVIVHVLGHKSFYGLVDTVTYMFSTEGEKMTLQGRDLTAVFQDTTLESDLANELYGKTASEIVRAIAKELKFKAKIQRTQKTYDERTFAAGTTLWDVIVALARSEGMNAYVDTDGVLHFHKPVRKEKVAVFRWRGDLTPQRLEVNQDKTLSLSLKVVVIGWDPEQKMAFKSDPAESPLRNRPGTKTIVIQDFSVKTKTEANRKAQELLRFFSRNYMRATLTLPLSETVAKLEIEDFVALEGIGRHLGGEYFVEEIQHTYGVEGGITTLTLTKKVVRGEPVSVSELEEVS